MKHSTVLLTLVLAATVATSAMAQTPGPAAGQGNLQLGHGAKGKHGANVRMWFQAEKEILPKLSLSKEQQDQISALNTKTQSDAKDLRKSTATKEDRAAKMKELSEKYTKDFFAILSPAQTQLFKQEFKTFAKKWHQEHKNLGGAPSTAPAPSAPAKSGGGI
jgi:Spy/CpxP family protein refolding chaperone